MNEEVVIYWEAPWWRFWNRNPIKRVYFGSGTVWRDAETGRRVSTYRQLRIADIVAYRRYQDANRRQV